MQLMCLCVHHLDLYTDSGSIQYICCYFSFVYLSLRLSHAAKYDAYKFKVGQNQVKQCECDKAIGIGDWIFQQLPEFIQIRYWFYYGKQ